MRLGRGRTAPALNRPVGSPCIVADDADVQVSARRIAWGKFMNCGQACIAPDYVLCTRDMQSRLVPAIKACITKFYGVQPKSSPSYGRIVNDAHVARIMRLMEGLEVACGGETDREDRYIAPTLLVNVPPNAPIMQEEVTQAAWVAPIGVIANGASLGRSLARCCRLSSSTTSRARLSLSIRGAHNVAVSVNGRRPHRSLGGGRSDKALALYLFTGSRAVQDAVMSQTTSGAFVVNDTLMHAVVSSLPFGGVGASGIGAYHGQYSFETFSHRRAVLINTPRFDVLNAIRYPPYSETKVAVRECVCSRCGAG